MDKHKSCLVRFLDQIRLCIVSYCYGWCCFLAPTRSLRSANVRSFVRLFVSSSGSNLSRAFNLHAIFMLSSCCPSAVPQRSLSGPSAVPQRSISSSLWAVSHQSLSSTHSNFSILHQTVGAQNSSSCLVWITYHTHIVIFSILFQQMKYYIWLNFEKCWKNDTLIF